MGDMQVMKKKDDASPQNVLKDNTNSTMQNKSNPYVQTEEDQIDVLRNNIGRFRHALKESNDKSDLELKELLEQIKQALKIHDDKSDKKLKMLLRHFKQSVNENNEMSEKELDELLCHMASSSKNIYQIEVDRESGIIQQASNMQAAFSFVTAGLFVLAQIVCDHKGDNLPWLAIAICFGIVAVPLITCLFLATKAQSRFIREQGPQSVLDIVEQANDNFDIMMNKYTRVILSIETYNGLYTDLRKVNEKRIKLVQRSMNFFYISLVLSVISVVALALIDGL